MTDIYHHHVHGNPTNDGAGDAQGVIFSVLVVRAFHIGWQHHTNISGLIHHSGIAITIADTDYRHMAGVLGGPITAIADTFACLQVMHRHDAYAH